METERQNYFTITEAANRLAISKDLVDKFIKRGWIIPVEEGKRRKLTPYALRRLNQIVALYEQSCSFEKIENYLNH
ncbi:MAG: MerR family transcriptional regulator [Calditrichaeota bacterium]|nr:MAG: MerR family transcriptional regulator [Calditrichota bacterium]